MMTRREIDGWNFLVGALFVLLGVLLAFDHSLLNGGPLR